MMAKLQIGEVLLATCIGDVLREFRVAIVPGDAPVPDQFTKRHALHLRKFGGLPEG